MNNRFGSGFMLYFFQVKILLSTHRLEPIIHLLGDLVAAVGFPVSDELIECIDGQFAVDDFVEGFKLRLTEQVPLGYHGWCGCAREIVLFEDVDLGHHDFTSVPVFRFTESDVGLGGATNGRKSINYMLSLKK